MHKSILNLTAAALLSWAGWGLLTNSASAQTPPSGASSQEVKELRDEVSKLKRDTIDIYKKLLDADAQGGAGLSKDQLEKLEQISTLEEKLSTLSEQNAELKKTLEAIKESPAPAAAPSLEAAPAATPTDEWMTKVTEAWTGANHAWVLTMGFLVMLMQAGFALVETGFTRAKNAVHTVSMNLMDYCIGMLAYWAFGFAIMFGNIGSSSVLGFEGGLDGALGITIGETVYTLIGTKGWFLTGENIFQGGIFTLFMFQLVFCNTANTIPTGTLAERWRIPSFIMHSIIVSGFLYPIFGHWVWGGGWLSKIGYWDFAGSSVVHMAGGVIALAGAKVIGPRLGKFNPDGTPNPIPGHNLPMAFLGTFLLAFGWFAFNSGSTLAATDANIGLIAVNTALASGAGACTATLATWYKFGKPDPSFCCNGMLGGLVAVTAPCAFVDPWAAVVIGAVAGVIVVVSCLVVEEALKLDDPVGAISVHGACGAFGCLALGIFANGKYLGVAGLVAGNGGQFVTQLIGILACFLFFFPTSLIMFAVSNRIAGGGRASDAEQLEGLDLSEMGVEAYPDSK